jgi:hypothetical protein
MDMTVDEFGAAVRGFRRKQEWQQQQEWERSRWVATILMQPHLKKGHRIKPADLAVFPWEEEKKQPVDGLAILQAYGTKRDPDKKKKP